MNRNHHRRFRQLACGVLCASGLVSAQADFVSQVLANNPVAYWRLNDNVTVPAGDVARNSGSLGAAADGYYTGTALHPTWGALVGSSDTAAGFDATAGSVVNIPYAAAMNPNGAFTVEAWLSPNVEHPAGTLTCALSSGVFSDPRSGWLIYQSDTGWNFRMYHQQGLATSLDITGGPAPMAGAWYHVAAVYDGTTAKVYVNGAERASGTPTGFVPSAGGPMFIGGRSDSSFWWNGTADEVAVYDKALTATEIDARYRNGISASPSTPYNQLILASNPLAYYRLNEDAYSPPDTLPAAQNLGSLGAAGAGSWNPGAKAGAAGPRPPTYTGFAADNAAAAFNGLAGHVGTTVTLNDLSAFTMMGWIKRGAIRSTRGGYFGQNDLLEFGDAGGGASIEMWSSASGQILIPYPFQDDEWGFLAVVGDGSQIVLYVNGLPAFTRESTVATYGSSTYHFNIGGGGVFNATGDPFLGNIDEVAIFDKALTTAQVQDIYYSANIAPRITTQPQAPDRDLSEGNSATLTVVASGTPPLSYQWRKDGENLAGKTTPELALTSLRIADSGVYDVVVTNPYGSATSSPVTLEVSPAETVPPTLVAATGNRYFNRVRVWFSEGVDPATASVAANYQLSAGVTVSAAAPAAPAGSPGDNEVVLTTSAQTPGTLYTLTVSNVKDQSLAGNVIAPGSTLEFSSWVILQGLEFEHYNNLPGASDADITRSLQDPRVIAGTPTTYALMSGDFSTRNVFPTDANENHLVRMTGWITPTQSGDYDFFINADDAARLYLSMNESIPDPATATPIAMETDCCDAFQEPGTLNDDQVTSPTTTTPIPLVAGRRYGVLALLKEAGGGDYLRIAWRKTDDFTPAGDLQPIPAQFLSTAVDPNVDILFTKQPTDQQAVPATSTVFTSLNFATTNGGMTVLDTTDKIPPQPWNYAGGEWAAGEGTSGCDGPYNSRLISPAFTVPEDSDVTLSFAHRYNTEPDLWDAGQVLFSVNGGAFTPVIPGNFTANGYAAGNIVGTGPIQGQRGFNAKSPGYDSGTFITSTVLLGRFKKDDKVAVQFLMAWDDCSTAEAPNWVVKSLDLSYGVAVPVTFDALATASKRGQPMPVGYQWQRNDGAGWVDIPNQTSTSLYFVPVAADFNATFRVLARVPGKDVPSNVVRITTGPVGPPEISIAGAGGTITITYTGTLESATSVQGPYSAVANASSPYTVPNPTGTRFYRASQ
ncbi:MAG: immunoglobulin domain-containing protein [Verrucomicrobiales bacterium]|nr:immunoglobulin domain-containing protein [Verrucomicrobiales bacterium]